MNFQSLLIPKGHPNRSGRKLLGLNAIVIHYTANDRPSATDTMNAKYFARPWVSAGGKPYEADGKTPFAYGSAHIIADMDSVTMAIPTDEVAWACGDARLPKDNGYNGQHRVASTVLEGLPNYFTVSVEICNNDVIPNSTADWDAAVANAAEWAAGFLKTQGLKVNIQKSLDPQNVEFLKAGEILILRHYDVTGKNCPAPFVTDAKAWEALVRKIASMA